MHLFVDRFPIHPGTQCALGSSVSLVPPGIPIDVNVPHCNVLRPALIRRNVEREKTNRQKAEQTKPAPPPKTRQTLSQNAVSPFALCFQCCVTGSNALDRKYRAAVPPPVRGVSRRPKSSLSNQRGGPRALHRRGDGRDTARSATGTVL